jgi:hypothetical protein
MAKMTRRVFRERFRAATTPAERRRVWVDALESGLWRQGRFSLRKRGKDRRMHHCCLGVAEDLAGLKPFAEGESGVLSVQTLGALGLASQNGCYAGGQALSQDNDNGASFDEIAKVIRREPAGLLA